MENLENFAKTALQYEKYPDCDHIFSYFKCPECQNRELELTFEHHTGSSKEDFKGKIFAFCGKCNKISEIFSFTGDHRSLVKKERAVCECGNSTFESGQLERFENDFEKFFDEGAIVGKCTKCEKNQVFVFTD